VKPPDSVPAAIAHDEEEKRPDGVDVITHVVPR
jgi:hypothetical protein